jgi:hypothetical protein
MPAEEPNDLISDQVRLLQVQPVGAPFDDLKGAVVAPR